MQIIPRLGLDNSFNLDDELKKVSNFYELLSGAFINTVPILKYQLDLVDDVDISSERDANKSFLYYLVKQIEKLDSKYLISKIREDNLDELLDRDSVKREINIKENVILTKRGACTTNLEDIKTIRRLSFGACMFNDSETILRKNKILDIKDDLTYLFTLNGYELPYSWSKIGRSMYEPFFSSLINEALLDDNFKTLDGFTYNVLQECVYMLHLMTEFTVSIVECIMEIICMINNRIKTVSLVIDLKFNLKELFHPTFEHLLDCFRDERTVFYGFRKRKITGSKSELDRIREELNGNIDNQLIKNSINWSSKISDYNQSLIDAFQLYKNNCNTFSIKINELRETSKIFDGEKANIVQLFLSGCFIYVNELYLFIKNLEQRESYYESLYNNGWNFLRTLEILERQYPIKYGITPRSEIESPLTRSRSNSISRSNSTNISTATEIESPVIRSRSNSMSISTVTEIESPSREYQNFYHRIGNTISNWYNK